MPHQRVTEAAYVFFYTQMPAARRRAWYLRWRATWRCQHARCTNLARSMPNANPLTRTVTADILAQHGLLHLCQPPRRAIEPRLTAWSC
jgi:hypothetical protein